MYLENQPKAALYGLKNKTRIIILHEVFLSSPAFRCIHCMMFYFACILLDNNVPFFNPSEHA